MKLAQLSVALVALIAAPASFAQDSGEKTAGTTIIGERETAVGLYLLPWQEEAPSDIDRPPAQYVPGATPIEAAQLHALTASDEANAAYRRVRTEPR
ncbi:hypothetical protein [Solimonas soli]|uniref:hypothetical protein n=1 Tax=Solimonas soli TaxID=413479 RepID=UPI0004B555B5|nr:hypothetical protein [Solimonas soli]